MIVLLHGFAGAPASWDAVVERLPRGVAVRRPTLPGHAGRPVPRGGFEAAVAALAHELSDVAPGAHLVGYSLGARVALALLGGGSPRVARATLVGVHPGLTDPAERRARAAWDASWAETIEREGVSAFVRRWEQLPVFDGQSDAARRAQRDVREAHDAAGLAASMRTLGLSAMPNLWERLPGIDVPVTLVSGARDARFAALARRMAARLPCARVRRVAGAGHNPLVERPAALARLLSEEAHGRPVPVVA